MKITCFRPWHSTPKLRFTLGHFLFTFQVELENSETDVLFQSNRAKDKGGGIYAINDVVYRRNPAMQPGEAIHTADRGIHIDCQLKFLAMKDGKARVSVLWLPDMCVRVFVCPLWVVICTCTLCVHSWLSDNVLRMWSSLLCFRGLGLTLILKNAFPRWRLTEEAEPW